MDPRLRGNDRERGATVLPQTENQDINAQVDAALARLDRDAREVLLLARFQELSFAEISGILECSVGAAKVRAHRALRDLRDLYFKMQQEPRS